MITCASTRKKITCSPKDLDYVIKIKGMYVNAVCSTNCCCFNPKGYSLKADFYTKYNNNSLMKFYVIHNVRTTLLDTNIIR